MRFIRILICSFLFFWPMQLLNANTGQAVLLDIAGPIGPATSDYVKRAFKKTASFSADVVIIRMDTPGGLDTSMREIIQDIIASPVPIVSFVSPSGARAASAGTYILYASHIAAMAPATNLGAATPIQMAGFPGSEREKGNKDQGKEKVGQQQDPLMKKIVNDAVAYIRGLAQMRGRNAEWAEKAVREGVSLSAEEALAEGVIDLIATDISDLLASIDGRKVNVFGNETVLSTKQMTVKTIEVDWRSRLLAIITDPNVAYILMLVGIYGLIYEFANPGMILPGVAGTICLLMALFAFQVLPINYAGLALMLLGIAFMIGEVFVPSFGALGIGGVIAFVVGSIMLMDTDVPGYGISISLIGTFALLSAGIFMFILGLAIKAQKMPVVSGMEELIGSQGEVLDDFNHEGRIRVHSESWAARSGQPLHRGQRVRITGIDGLVLDIEPVSEEHQDG